MQNDDRYLKARQLTAALKRRHWSNWQQHRNIVGMAYGRREAHGERTDEPALVVYVVRKIPLRFLPPSAQLPRRMYVGGDKVEVDVVETGLIFPHSFTASERPTTHGISIAHVNVTAGTLGGLVIDNTDNETVILSNNHVLADRNLAALGDVIVQPGPFDGGTAAADRIGTLKRFVMINAAGNRVDAAIAAPDAAGDVSDVVHNNIIPIATVDHPAIGLLFAGSCNRTIMNPIADVMAQLNVSFAGGGNVTAAVDIGTNVEKVGRTTEYTTSSVTEIDVSTGIDYSDAGDGSDVRSFDGQIATAWMSDPGDSGSLVYRGGAGGNESHCDCGASAAARHVLGQRVDTERSMAEEVRDKFLRPTKLGRWAIDMFYHNEERFLERFHSTRIRDDDREHARNLYAKFGEEARAAFIAGAGSDRKVTEQHLREARQSLKRLQEYMTPAEAEASNELFALAQEYTRGRNAKELLALLNDERLFERVRAIVDKVPSVRKLSDC